MEDFYGIGEHKDANYKSLLDFVKQLKRDRKRGNKTATETDLRQIIGRAKNLLLELEEDV